MGGKILEHEGKTIYNNGFTEGEELGRSETLNAAIAFMQSQGITNEQINNFRASLLKNS